MAIPICLHFLLVVLVLILNEVILFRINPVGKAKKIFTIRSNPHPNDLDVIKRNVTAAIRPYFSSREDMFGTRQIDEYETYEMEQQRRQDVYYLQNELPQELNPMQSVRIRRKLESCQSILSFKLCLF
jgi:hypothetical protein